MIKKTDRVYCSKRQLTGQVVRIRHDLVTILLVTGDRIIKNKNDIYNVDGQWRIND
tara:strand:+ start:99 stop:266 length:168 start_codon:yes stop_codon:yes gene_type:complete